MIKVIVFDEQPLILGGIERLLSEQPDFDVLAYCTTGQACLDAARRHQPDILLLDPYFPDTQAMDVLRKLADEAQAPNAVILTRTLTEQQLLQAMRLGVRGVVLKHLDPALLVQCLRKVHSGEQWYEKASFGRALDMMLKREDRILEVRDVLTSREIDLGRLVASGLDNRRIAKQLRIAEGTVKVHLHRIYGKLAIRNRVELSRYMQENGLA